MSKNSVEVIFAKNQWLEYSNFHTVNLPGSKRPSPCGSKACCKSRQSPIDIEWANSECDLTAPKLKISGMKKRPQSVQAENIGNGIIFSMDYADGIPPIISGGPLGTNSYIFNSFHLHWGGSEHTFSGLKFGAELHLVHYNSKYDSYETAQNQDDGLAVLGFVYVSVPRIDILRSLPFIPLVGCVREPGATFNETDNVFTYRDVIQQKRFKFASYQGSLTSPPYPESVTWLVAFAPIVIEENELKVLQSIRDSNGRKLLKNSRSTQKACGRKPIVYFP